MLNITSFAENPIWNPLNFLAAFVVIILTVVLWIKSREKKELSYICLSDTSVVKINKSFAEKVKVTYLNLPANTLQLIRFKIINTGNQDILKKDFEEPLTFVDLKAGTAAKSKGFYLMDFPEKSPKDLRPEPHEHNGRLGIAPLLLNAGDSITIELLYVNNDVNKPELDMRGRIAGVKKIRELKPTDLMNSAILYLLFGTLTGIISITVIFVLGGDNTRGLLRSEWMAILISVLSLIIGFSVANGRLKEMLFVQKEEVQ